MRNWEELGNDRWKLTIMSDDPDDNSHPSVYRGTKAEIAEMLAESQSNANRRISELKRNGNGHAQSRGPVPLSPADRMQTVAELNDPATVDKAVTRVIESVIGPVDEQRQRNQKQDEEDIERRRLEAANRFMASTPEFFQSEHNAQTIVDYIINTGLDGTRPESYTVAFEKLSAAKLLQTKPKEAETEIESEEEGSGQRNAPVVAAAPRTPARISTGVMSRDISGTPPRPVARLKYTREQLDQMSAADYKRLMQSDPELSRCIEYYAAQDRQRQRRAG